MSMPSRRAMRAQARHRVRDQDGVVHAASLLSVGWGECACGLEWTDYEDLIAQGLANYLAVERVADGSPVTCLGCLLETS